MMSVSKVEPEKYDLVFSYIIHANLSHHVLSLFSFGCPNIKAFLFITVSVQICVVHSVVHGPQLSEYNVSGTTYAPDGIIFDNTGVQVIVLLCSL